MKEFDISRHFQEPPEVVFHEAFLVESFETKFLTLSKKQDILISEWTPTTTPALYNRVITYKMLTKDLDFLQPIVKTTEIAVRQFQEYKIDQETNTYSVTSNIFFGTTTASIYISFQFSPSLQNSKPAQVEPLMLSNTRNLMEMWLDMLYETLLRKNVLSQSSHLTLNSNSDLISSFPSLNNSDPSVSTLNLSTNQDHVPFMGQTDIYQSLGSNSDDLLIVGSQSSTHLTTLNSIPNQNHNVSTSTFEDLQQNQKPLESQIEESKKLETNSVPVLPIKSVPQLPIQLNMNMASPSTSGITPTTSSPIGTNLSGRLNYSRSSKLSYAGSYEEMRALSNSIANMNGELEQLRHAAERHLIDLSILSQAGILNSSPTLKSQAMSNSNDEDTASTGVGNAVSSGTQNIPSPEHWSTYDRELRAKLNSTIQTIDRLWTRVQQQTALSKTMEATWEKHLAATTRSIQHIRTMRFGFFASWEHSTTLVLVLVVWPMLVKLLTSSLSTPAREWLSSLYLYKILVKYVSKRFSWLYTFLMNLISKLIFWN